MGSISILSSNQVGMRKIVLTTAMVGKVRPVRWEIIPFWLIVFRIVKKMTDLVLDIKSFEVQS